LVGLKPDVLVPVGSGNLQAVRRTTQTIPIVFLQVSDPVAQGIVKNLARPGENTTGFSAFESEMGSKWLGQLKQIAPAVRRAVVMFNPSTSPQSNVFVHSMQSGARALGLQVTAAHVTNDEEIEATIADAAKHSGTGIVIPTDSFTQTRAGKLVALMNHHRVPAIYAVLLYARAGGLLCYTVDFPEQFKQAASYVDRILKGAKAGDLPVQTPTKFSLVINRSTAKLLGLEVPERLLFTADEVIE
jgi:putative ABC transport system substrate-binding protein